jgi:hypothetical protein
MPGPAKVALDVIFKVEMRQPANGQLCLHCTSAAIITAAAMIHARVMAHYSEQPLCAICPRLLG